MNSVLFLVAGLSMVSVMRGRTGWALTLFAIGICASAAWFNYHVTSVLPLEF